MARRSPHPDEPLLSRLDLNLLVSLDALLTERNVTRAAERLYMSQPSLSAALARLRSHFDDQLLARRGNTYELTPLAARLAEHTTIALNAARRVFESQARWDPKESARHFTIHGSDYALTTIGARASRLVSQEAPNVQLRLVPTTSPGLSDVLQRLASVDGIVLPHGVVSGRPHADLYRDDWVLVAAKDNPRTAEGITLELLAASPWVYTYQTRSAFTAVGLQLQQLGLQPRVETVVESFLLLPLFVAHTERLAIVQRMLVPLVTQMAEVAVHELPFTPTPLISALWWHPIHDHDPEHAWLREVFQRAGRELQAEAATQHHEAPES
ncbi:MAG TPA: LysR family transcriptional regulator [Actinomycetaceae bacterium]|nr:LysR family transcriptional regulator [Actinomycetaceae bacterium]